MSNIEGEKLMGQGSASVDVAIVRGPKGQAVDLLTELKALRSRSDRLTREAIAGKLPVEQGEELHEAVSEYNRKCDDVVLFLLEQFSK